MGSFNRADASPFEAKDPVKSALDHERNWLLWRIYEKAFRKHITDNEQPNFGRPASVLTELAFLASKRRHDIVYVRTVDRPAAVNVPSRLLVAGAIPRSYRPNHRVLDPDTSRLLRRLLAHCSLDAFDELAYESSSQFTEFGSGNSRARSRENANMCVRPAQLFVAITDAVR
jgi:hypothetical protein